MCPLGKRTPGGGFTTHRISIRTGNSWNGISMHAISLCLGINASNFDIYTETKMSSFWRNFHHWLHWKLSFWQLPVQPVMNISSKWRLFRFSVPGPLPPMLSSNPSHPTLPHCNPVGKFIRINYRHMMTKWKVDNCYSHFKNNHMKRPSRSNMGGSRCWPFWDFDKIWNGIILVIDECGISYKDFALIWMSPDLANDKWTLVQVRCWRR